MIIGMATSMQVTSTPSMTSRRLPVGSILPDTEPTTSMKLRMIGAAVPGTPSMLSVPQYSASCRQGVCNDGFDPGLRVDVVDHQARFIVLVLWHEPSLDRERRDAREHISARRRGIDDRPRDIDLGKKVVEVHARTGGFGYDGNLACQRTRRHRDHRSAGGRASPSPRGVPGLWSGYRTRQVGWP